MEGTFGKHEQTRYLLVRLLEHLPTLDSQLVQDVKRHSRRRQLGPSARCLRSTAHRFTARRRLYSGTHLVPRLLEANSVLQVDEFLDRGARQACFMLQGLQSVERKLKEKSIPFFLLRGDPGQTLPELARRCEARLIAMDYSPLREAQKTKHAVSRGSIALSK